jgi:cation diffusion facilitator CzcD-associated flavoprotein CzcO
MEAHICSSRRVVPYLQHLVERHDLRQHMQFDTEIIAAEWANRAGLWVVHTSTGQELTGRNLVTAVGLLSREHFPRYPGIDKFTGQLYHTASWPKSSTLWKARWCHWKPLDGAFRSSPPCRRPTK